MRIVINNPANTKQPASRATQQKAAIAEAIQASDRALTAQELHERLDNVGLATVYRNLARLADEGAIDSIRRPSGEIAYRACAHGHHHHLICRDCGTVVELHDCSLDEWSSRIGQQFGFSSVEHQAELQGTCAKCSAASAGH